jgi:hypothetical protein
MLEGLDEVWCDLGGRVRWVVVLSKSAMASLVGAIRSPQEILADGCILGFATWSSMGI